MSAKILICTSIKVKDTLDTLAQVGYGSDKELRGTELSLHHQML